MQIQFQNCVPEEGGADQQEYETKLQIHKCRSNQQM